MRSYDVAYLLNLMYVQSFFVIALAVLSHGFEDQQALRQLARFSNTIWQSLAGDCFCSEDTSSCVISAKGTTHQVDSPIAALITQELFKQSLGKNVDKWPPAHKYVPEDPSLGPITGKEEPLLHLKRYPLDLKKINTAFKLFAENGLQKGKEISYRDKEELQKLPKYNRLYVVIHGWVGSADDRDLVLLKDKLLVHKKSIGGAVLMVDWSKGAVDDVAPCINSKDTIAKSPCVYEQAAANALIVGRQVGLLVHRFVEYKKINDGSVHLIGLGLGAQVAHFAGQWFNNLQVTYKKIGRLTALDPFSLHFEGYIGASVIHSDATFVDVIHSSSVSEGNIVGDLLENHLGVASVAGHIDFYVNGGQRQPGCGPIESSNLAVTCPKPRIMCDHYKALEYFIDSLDVKNRALFEAFPLNMKAYWKNKPRFPYFKIMGVMGFDAPDYCDRGVMSLYYKGSCGQTTSSSRVSFDPVAYSRFIGVQIHKQAKKYFGKTYSQRIMTNYSNSNASLLTQNSRISILRDMTEDESRSATSRRADSPHDHPQCGLYRAKGEERIYLGQTAYSGQFPWTVQLLAEQYDGVWLPMCTAGIVNERWLITAAHCFLYVQGELFMSLNVCMRSRWMVKYGYDDVMNPATSQHTYFFANKIEGDPRRTVFTFPGHQDCSHMVRGNDFAMIRLPLGAEILGLPGDGQLYTGGNVNRLCLDLFFQVPFFTYHANAPLFFAGFGLRQDHPSRIEGDGILTHTMMYYNPDLCFYDYNPNPTISFPKFTLNNENVFCVASLQLPFPKPCAGDSGAPAVVYVPYESKDPRVAPHRALNAATVLGGWALCGVHYHFIMGLYLPEPDIMFKSPYYLSWMLEIMGTFNLVAPLPPPQP